MRIGIIDDGIDITRPSFSGAGYSYPPGFPKGSKKGANGKVIVARAFAPPGTGPREHTAFDPNGSDHGTHVAGIAAGESGIVAIGRRRPRAQPLRRRAATPTSATTGC